MEKEITKQEALEELNKFIEEALETVKGFVELRNRNKYLIKDINKQLVYMLLFKLYCYFMIYGEEVYEPIGEIKNYYQKYRQQLIIDKKNIEEIRKILKTECDPKALKEVVIDLNKKEDNIIKCLKHVAESFNYSAMNITYIPSCVPIDETENYNKSIDEKIKKMTLKKSY